MSVDRFRRLTSLGGWAARGAVQRRAFGEARTHIRAGKTLVLSCAQKVCISGDYGDMHPVAGATLTASLRVRPALRIRSLGSAESSTVLLNGVPLTDFERWELVKRFLSQVAPLPGAYEFDVVPTLHRNVGLGSSGAASVLFATSLAVLRGDSPTRAEIIMAAHTFENELAQCPCGPQDHAASVLGGLNLIEFPSLQARRVPDGGVWSALSFWTAGEQREAHELIPDVVDRHTEKIWQVKAELTGQIADACAAGDIAAVVAGFQREAVVQHELGMLTDQQRGAIDAVGSAGASAKVSGAGGGGVLVVAAATASARERVADDLLRLGYRPLALSVDGRGLRIERR